MELLNNSIFRLVIITLVVLFLIFFGAYFRRTPNNQQTVNEEIASIGKAIQVVALFNTVVLFIVEYNVEKWGIVVFYIVFLILFIFDIIVVIMSLKKKNNK